MKPHPLPTLLFALAALALTATAQTDYAHYQMAGPYAVVARDGQYRASKGGSERDMYAALQCAQQGLTEQARRIIDAYAATLQRFDGHDAPLCCIQGYHLVRAMTLLKAHTPDTTLRAWSDMVRRAILPTISQFEARSPYANGNWGAIVNRQRMACAIFLADTALYRQAIDYHLHAYDNGALPHYVGPTGQCQETGRDQNHVQLGLGALCDLCDMAWQQGDDLWGALDNRLMHAIEYTARYNLGHDVSFQTWTDCTGLYNDWSQPGAMGRGRLWDIYRKPYDHYVRRLGLKMPYTRRVLAIQDRALRKGTAQQGTETTVTLAPGVSEGKRIHQLYAYPAPEGAPLKHDFDVYVQPRGASEWTHIDTYMAKVNAPYNPHLHRISEVSYALFDFTGDVFVRVVKHGGPFRSARIRPDFRGVIANTLNDSTIQFTLFQPENLSVEFDGDIAHNLHLFTARPPFDRQEAQRQAEAQGRQFIYYPPGYYDQVDTIRVPSSTTVYLEGGAYLNATLAIDDAHDVSILGRGIARPQRGYEGCHVYRSKNVVVDGLTLCTCPVGGSDGVAISNLRSISHPAWGDGLNVFASSNVSYHRVFCRNSDDCTTAYATRKGFEGNARNITMTDATLWADVAHPIFIGLHGAAAGPHPERTDTVENLTYENIDILCQAEPQVDYQGCLAINAGDNNLVRNVRFNNIRIEQLAQGSLLHVKVAYNQKYCKAPGLGVDGVTFSNVRYDGPLPYLSVINGYDPQRTVRNVQFHNLKVNGQTLYDDMPGKPKWYSTADYVPIFIGNHTENIKFYKE